MKTFRQYVESRSDETEIEGYERLLGRKLTQEELNKAEDAISSANYMGERTGVWTIEGALRLLGINANQPGAENMYNLQMQNKKSQDAFGYGNQLSQPMPKNWQGPGS